MCLASIVGQILNKQKVPFSSIQSQTYRGAESPPRAPSAGVDLGNCSRFWFLREWSEVQYHQHHSGITQEPVRKADSQALPHIS